MFAKSRPRALGALLPSKHWAVPCSLNHLKEPQKSHERSNNPQMGAEWTASQESSLSKEVGRGHTKRASALGKYFISQVHAAYLINPHHYFRAFTHLTYPKQGLPKCLQQVLSPAQLIPTAKARGAEHVVGWTHSLTVTEAVPK